jgi:DNA-binding LacI/PurR family transcriptional regulator
VALPLALIDFWMPGRPSVNPDNERGGYIATRHLLGSGRKRIAFLSGSLAITLPVSSIVRGSCGA